MLTPKENPEGYAKTSCVAAAKNLHGKLLIVHGMMDDNVHLQNSVQLVDALAAGEQGLRDDVLPAVAPRHRRAALHEVATDFIRRTMGVK